MKMLSFLQHHWLAWCSRRDVQRERKRIALEIVEHLRLYPNDSVAVLERRLRLHSSLAGALKPTLNISVPVAVAFLSIALALLLWKLPLPHTAVVARIYTEAARFKLAGDWEGDMSLPLAGAFRLDGLTELTSPALFKNITSTNGNAWIDIHGRSGRVRLNHLHLDRTTWFEVDRLDQVVNFYITGPARGRLGLSDRVHATVGGGDGGHIPSEIRHDKLLVPEQLEFRANGESTVPMTLSARPDLLWVMRQLRVDAIRFSKEVSRAPGESSFHSAIASGTVKLYDVNESFDLASHDSLSLEAFAGHVVHLQGNPSDPRRTIEVVLQGTANRVLRGLEDTSQDLTPSMLKYLYHQKSTTLLALGIPWLWSLLWSVRRVLSR
jgi:hypothetical protein